MPVGLSKGTLISGKYADLCHNPRLWERGEAARFLFCAAQRGEGRAHHSIFAGFTTSSMDLQTSEK